MVKNEYRVLVNYYDGKGENVVLTTEYLFEAIEEVGRWKPLLEFNGSVRIEQRTISEWKKVVVNG